MSVNEILPIIGAGLLVVTVFYAITHKTGRHHWMGPLMISAVFLVFSIFTIAKEGLFGFWENHARDFWGNQIWFDLILGIGTAFVILLERLRARKMNPLLWFVFVLTGGSIGLLVMLARLLYLEAKEKTG